MQKEKQYKTIELFNAIRFLLTAIPLVLMTAISAYISFVTNFWFGLSFLLVVGALFAWDSIVIFPDEPPTKWMPEVFGVSVNILKPWGLAWIPLRSSYTIGYTTMPGGIMHADLDPKVLIPGDRTTIIIPTHLFFSVDPENPMQVFLVGGLDNAKLRLLELIGKLLRQWVTSPQKGPEKLSDTELTLDRARQMSNEAINEILESLVNDDITQIPSGIPTEALLGYFEGRPLSPWEQRCIDDYGKKSEDEKTEIKTATQKRLSEITAVRNGEKTFAVNSVGLIVRQMIVDNIKPDEPTAAFISKVAEEHFAAEQRKIRTESFAQQAERLASVTKDMDPLQAGLIIEGKTDQKIQVNKLEFSPAITTILDGIAKPIANAVASRISGGKEKS